MRYIICFHKPEEENGYLSNWYPSPFEKDGISFAHMEQYMMYQKALQFQDTEIAQQICKTTPPALSRLWGEASGTMWTPGGVQSGSKLFTTDCWKNSGKTSRFCKNCWQLHRICWQNVRYTTGSGALDCP